MKTARRPTQIICTIGPACRSLQRIESLIKAGMDVARLHFSYAGQKEHAVNIRRIRHASRKLHRKVLILQDLSGTKVRLGEIVPDSVELKKGAAFSLTSRPVKGNASIATISIPELIPVVQSGDIVLLADGAVKMQATSKTSTDLQCKISVGGRIKSHVAVHVLGKAPNVSVPTDKDLKDVEFGLANEVDWIALSYATRAEEINRLKSFLRERGAHTRIVAKIERREALDNLEEMVRAADLVMVARGDLGLAIPLEQIALAQKTIIACAKRIGKPAITATEMLFSMMENDRPTRAEVADVTNAILDGSSAVMLSGETSMGMFPIEATRMLAKISALADQAETNNSEG